MTRIITTLAVLLLSTPAWAQSTTTTASADQPSDEPIYRRGGLAGTGLVFAPKLGLGFGKVFSDFGTTPVFELEVGWIIKPFPDLQLFTNLGYVAPKQDGGGTDERLPGSGAWTYTLKQESLVLTPGFLYRIPVGGKWFRPYLAVGPRFYFNRTTVEGSAGAEAFGEYKEKSTSVGVYGAIGGDLFVGPGSILLEIQAATSRINEYVLQDTNNGALNIAIGYRFFL